VLPRPLARFKGLLVREGKAGRTGGKGKGEERRGEGMGREGKRTSDRSPVPNLPLHHCLWCPL